jgi:hypothetical protein
MSQPSLENLIELVLDSPRSASGTGPGVGISASPRPAGRFQRVQQLLDSLTRPLADAPEASVAAARAQLAATSSLRHWLDSAGRTVAQLITGFQTGPIVPGFRGGQDSGQLAFTSDRGDLDLRIESTGPEEWCITGQVAPAGGEPVHLIALSTVAQGEVLNVVQPGQRNGFSLACDRGTYDVMALVGAEWVVAPGVQVG